MKTTRLIALFSAAGALACGILPNWERPGQALLAHLGPAMQKVTYSLLSPFHLKAATSYPGLGLAVAPLPVQPLGPDALGLVGVSLFLGLFAYFSFTKNPSPGAQRVLLPVGILFMLWLNAVRLALKILADLKIQQWWGPSAKASLYSSVVDGNLGWMLYASGLFLFFTIAMRVGVNRAQGEK